MSQNKIKTLFSVFFIVCNKVKWYNTLKLNLEMCIKMVNPDLEIKNLNLIDLQIDLEPFLISNDINLYQFNVDITENKLLETQHNPIWSIRSTVTAEDYIKRYNCEKYVFANIHDVMIQLDIVQVSYIINQSGSCVWVINPNDPVQSLKVFDRNDINYLKVYNKYQFFIEKSKVCDYLPSFGEYHSLLKLREKSK